LLSTAGKKVCCKKITRTCSRSTLLKAYRGAEV
jgi:hypothetical protein